MKRILVCVLLFPLSLQAQQISSTGKDHRLYLNPVSVLVGDFEVSYCWKAGNKFFLEPTIGYHYFPFSIKQNGFATPGVLAVPELGLGYHGPYVKFAARTYLNRDPEMFIKAEVFYKIQSHPPACYAEGELPSRRYSGDRQGVGLRVLLGFTHDPSKSYSGKYFIEPYGGAGLKFYWGTLTKYLGGNYDTGCYTSGELTSPVQFISFVPGFYFGVRIGWQVAKQK